MRECTRCKKEKSFEEFNFKIKASGLRQLQCRECTRLLIKNHYNENREYYLEKAKKRNHQLRLEIIGYLQKYLQKNPCIDCGETDVTVLEFDHKGEIPKFMSISLMLRKRLSLRKIQEEIDKCEIRCANCHRRKTAKQFKWIKSSMHP